MWIIFSGRSTRYKSRARSVAVATAVVDVRGSELCKSLPLGSLEISYLEVICDSMNFQITRRSWDITRNYRQIWRPDKRIVTILPKVELIQLLDK